MDEYLNHLIYHLDKFGNVYFPSNRRIQYGEDNVVRALKDKGYPCTVRHFQDALMNPDELMEYIGDDAVLTLIKENDYE